MSTLLNLQHRSAAAGRAVPQTIWVLIGLIATLLSIKWLLIGRLAIQGDEFFFLSQIYSHQAGELNKLFQTFHVHFLSWIANPELNEVEQVILGRKAAFLARLISSTMVFVIARKLYGSKAALLALLCTLSFGYILRHGEALRYDSWISCLFLMAAALLILRQKSAVAAALAGTAFAFSFAISIKTAIYAPTVVLLFACTYWRHGFRTSFFTACAFSVAAASMGSTLLLWHKSQLTTEAKPVTDQAVGIQGAGAGVFDPPHIFPRAKVVSNSIAQNPVEWLAMLCGGVISLLLLLRSQNLQQRQRALIAVALALPMWTLLIYENAWPYYFVSIVPSAVILVAALYDYLRMASQSRPRLALMVASTAFLIWTASLSLQLDKHRIDRVAHQRDFIKTIHKIFPSPVPYLDRAAMITEYPSAHSIMTTATLNTYRKKGRPIMRRVLTRKNPNFLIINTPTLALNASWQQMSTSGMRLLREDFETLQQNFIQHWGALFVAGKHLPELPVEGANIEILISGEYTLESEHAVLLNEEAWVPNESRMLEQQVHRIQATKPDQSVTLRIGRRLLIPKHAHPRLPLVNG